LKQIDVELPEFSSVKI